MNDLFIKEKSKKERLKDFILSKNWIQTHEVLKWGIDNYHNRALRDAQEMCASGEFRRMTKEEKIRCAFFGKEDVWVKNEEVFL